MEASGGNYSPFSYKGLLQPGRLFDRRYTLEDSNLEVRVQEYRGRPTVCFAKQKGFISMSDIEFNDIAEKSKVIQKALKDCKKAILRQFGHVSYISKKEDYSEQIPHSEKSSQILKSIDKRKKKLAEQVSSDSSEDENFSSSENSNTDEEELIKKPPTKKIKTDKFKKRKVPAKKQVKIDADQGSISGVTSPIL